MKGPRVGFLLHCPLWTSGAFYLRVQYVWIGKAFEPARFVIRHPLTSCSQWIYKIDTKQNTKTNTSGEIYHRQVTVQELANSISAARIDMAYRTNKTDRTDMASRTNRTDRTHRTDMAYRTNRTDMTHKTDI